MTTVERRESTALPRDDFERRLQEFVGRPYGRGSVARDPINMPMIHHLTDALGDRNPVYLDEEFATSSVFKGIVAPPTSLQVWTMQGLAGRQAAPEADDAQAQLMRLFEEAGYVGVVATNCEQVYHRPLRLGLVLTSSSEVEAISGLKHTALGEGYFLTTVQKYHDEAGELVGEMRFRILKFKPGTGRTADADSAAAADADARSASGDGRDAAAAEWPPPDFPPAPRDAAFFWEGVERGELRIQRCAGCGRLRHPPRPMCPHCRSLDHDHVVASGRGTVFSHVVHHHPPVPGREHPFVVALVELEEGTRIVGNLLDVSPDAVRIGLPVEVTVTRRADGRPLPNWRPRGEV